jgi:CHAT domain-containing protein
LVSSGLLCGAPVAAVLEDGAAARVIGCTRRFGGWPHFAMVAAGPDGPVAADGLIATRPVIEQMIGGHAGSAPAGNIPTAPPLRVLLARLTAGAYSAADIGQYEALMTLGSQLNQAEDYSGAEQAYRAALAIQERLLGADNPNTATALMSLAINLADQGRGGQAAPLFARAARLAPRAADPLTPARLLHYRGLEALAAGDARRAADLLSQAEQDYGAFVPPRERVADEADVGAAILSDPLTQSALLGLAEARRSRGVALGRQGDPRAGEVLATEARAMLRDARLEPNVIVGRSLRTVAGSAGAQGQQDDAAQFLTGSVHRFELGAPGERPEAVTDFLAGGRALEAGQTQAALAAFRAGAKVLRAREIALPTPLLLPYLDALWTAGGSDGTADVTAEMFLAAQFAQHGQAAQIISQAAARLGAAGGNPLVAAAVRRLQDADRDLSNLYAARDAADTLDAPAYDAPIAAAQAARAEAESAVAAAAPGYQLLLQTVAEAAPVAAVLGPKEALVTMLVGETHGYAFALRHDGAVTARRIDVPQASLRALVGRVRAAMEPGSDGQPPPFDADASATIYQDVLAPLSPALAGTDALLISPDGPLLAIPFDLLLTAKLAGPASSDALRDAAWLVRDHVIAHVPTPQTLATLRGKAGASAGTQAYIGFGDPVLPTPPQLARFFPADRCGNDAARAATLGSLPGTRAELETARGLTGATPADVVLGANFNAARLFGANLADRRIIHFATHALLAGELSCLREPTILVSAPQGATDADTTFVPASRLINLKLDADLVILSACNTGTAESGGSAGGEALSGLARAFFFAGARGLLVTNWDVDDTAARLTIALTLNAQKGGNSSGAALREAQLAILRNAGQRLPAAYAHPYYWAPFAMIGDGKRDTGAKIAAFVN